MPEQSPYQLVQLENYIALVTHLTGEKPKTLAVKPDFYNWYVQEAQRHAETLGLNLGFAKGVPYFDGIEITKKEVTSVPGLIQPK